MKRAYASGLAILNVVLAWHAGFALAAPESAVASQAMARELAAKALGDDARDLVFVPITPCTVWDTRFAAGAPFAGAVADATTRRFYSHLDAAGGDFTAYGGNPACAEANETFLGGRPYAAMMIVYVNNPVGNGWLTFYRDGDPDPSQATISVYYSPGPTRTQTVISKSNRGYGAGTYDVAVTGRFSTADASAAVVGYFLKPVNIALSQSTATSGNILKGGTRFIHNFGGDNTFIGDRAGNLTMSGGGNAGLGAFALFGVTSGSANTAAGAVALGNLKTGSNNTAMGFGALIDNLAGNYNTALGNDAGKNLTGDFNIAIGNWGVAGESNTTRIGDSSQVRTYISGIRGITTVQTNAVPVLIDSDGQLGTINSSRRVKDDIVDMSGASSALMKLRPVTFAYKPGRDAAERRLEYGLIAEEVAEVYPGLVAHSRDGEVETVMYQYLPSMLLNEVQKQARRIAELERQVGELLRSRKR